MMIQKYINTTVTFNINVCLFCININIAGHFYLFIDIVDIDNSSRKNAWYQKNALEHHVFYGLSDAINNVCLPLKSVR